MTISDIAPWNWKKKKLPITQEENPFTGLQKRVNRLFEDFFSGFELEPFGSLWEGGSFSPKLNVTEDEKELRVTAELPGMDEKDIDISLTKDALTIRGEKKEEYEEKEGKNSYYTERSYGSFQRTIPLTVAVDEDKIDASFKKGLLTIRLPKTAEAQRETKKITIRS